MNYEYHNTVNDLEKIVSDRQEDMVRTYDDKKDDTRLITVSVKSTENVNDHTELLNYLLENGIDGTVNGSYANGGFWIDIHINNGEN